MLRALLVILVVTCCSFHPPQNASSDQQIRKVAETQLPMYLARINPGNETDYGFTVNDNLANCEIGKPYRLLVFNSDYYTGNLVENTNYLEIQNEWRAPVNLNGQSRVLLTITGNPGNFTVTDFGDTSIAKELQAKSMLTDKEDVFYLLRINLLTADFLVAEHDNSFADAKFIPLASAVKAIPAMGSSKKNWYALDEIQQMVKEAIARKQAQKEPSKKKAPAKNKKKKAQ
jgi:hypothetical protein